MNPTTNTEAGAVADVAAIARGLTTVQRKAISIAIFLVGDWVLTTDYEDHPDIMDDLSEDIADPVSGILTPLGLAVRQHLEQGATAGG